MFDRSISDKGSDSPSENDNLKRDDDLKDVEDSIEGDLSEMDSVELEQLIQEATDSDFSGESGDIEKSKDFSRFFDMI